MPLTTQFDTPASVRDMPASSQFYNNWHTFLRNGIARETVGERGGAEHAVVGERGLELEGNFLVLGAEGDLESIKNKVSGKPGLRKSLPILQVICYQTGNKLVFMIDIANQVSFIKLTAGLNTGHFKKDCGRSVHLQIQNKFILYKS